MSEIPEDCTTAGCTEDPALIEVYYADEPPSYHCQGHALPAESREELIRHREPVTGRDP